MKKLTITRSKWMRGKGGSVSRLLIKEDNLYYGMMCCLGFDCLNRGLKPRDIEGLCEPSEIDIESKEEWNEIEYFRDMFDWYDEFNNGDLIKQSLIAEAIKLNDDEKISDEEREQKLIPILKEIGNYDEVEFVD